MDPIIIEIEEKVNDSFSYNLKNFIENQDSEDSEILLGYPVVYIHDYELKDGKHDVYVGESNDVVERTSEHYRDRKNIDKWQSNFFVNNRLVKMYIVGHKHFNKSLTLDIENKLINYIMSMENVNQVVNGRGNPQNKYYPNEEFDEIFHSVWKKLRKYNPNLFISESRIEDSAIFKASPLHKLTLEQRFAKEKILNQIFMALGNNKDHQLIFVEGEAGTGKTVLNSSVFYELLSSNDEEGKKPITCCLMVNQDEQRVVYEEIARKLNLKNANGFDVVMKPTPFINKAIKGDIKVDVAFVDEAHLLLTRGKQSYRGNNHLKDIMEHAKVTVIMFDEYQILKAEQYWEQKNLEEMRELAKSQNNYIDDLKTQMRMNAGEATLKWIDSITKKQEIINLGYDSSGYDIKICDTPEQLRKLITDKATKEETKLSRLIATYDWDYNVDRKPENKKYWNVQIGDFDMPWNRELFKELNKNDKQKYKLLAWAEQPQTIDEVGSTFTIQGFDLNYAGVIIGPSVSYKDGKIVFNPENSKSKGATNGRTLDDGTKANFGEVFLQHELRVLLTRGVNGLYIYACDKELNAELKKSVNYAKHIRDYKQNDGRKLKDMI